MDMHGIEICIEIMSANLLIDLFHTLSTHLQNDINVFKYHHHNIYMNT